MELNVVGEEDGMQWRKKGWNRGRKEWSGGDDDGVNESSE